MRPRTQNQPPCLFRYTNVTLLRCGRLNRGISILVGGVLAVTIARAEEELWKNCSTPTTDYVLQVPSSLVRSSSPEVPGCTYQSPDGEFNVEAAEQTDNQVLDARMEKEIDLLKGTVADQKKGDNWFALTGVTADGTEYYRLHYTNGAQWVSLRVSFPHSKSKKYSKWVDRIDKSFVPFSKTAKTEAPSPKPKPKQEQASPQP